MGANDKCAHAHIMIHVQVEGMMSLSVRFLAGGNNITYSDNHHTRKVSEQYLFEIYSEKTKNGRDKRKLQEE